MLTEAEWLKDILNDYNNRINKIDAEIEILKGKKAEIYDQMDVFQRRLNEIRDSQS